MTVRTLNCSFCGQPSHKVRKLIRTEDGSAAICEQCVLNCLAELASDPSLDEEMRTKMRRNASKLASEFGLPLPLSII